MRTTGFTMLSLLAVMLLTASSYQEPTSSDELTLRLEGVQSKDLVQAIFEGRFIEIPFDRDEMKFAIMFRAFADSYGLQCAANLPSNKLELTEDVCIEWTIEKNGYGVEVSRYCSRWETRGTGIYAKPEIFEAVTTLDRIQDADALRNTWGLITSDDAISNSLGLLADARTLKDDMDILVRINGCNSPGLARFEENLRLFAMNKQPIRMDGSSTNASDGLPECLYFFDFPNTCRTASRTIVSKYAEGAYSR